MWHDSEGNPHTRTQSEGGERGDPLMPVLHFLGQHAALNSQDKGVEWCGEQTHITSLGPNVWIGDSARPAAEQGRTVLGAPVGTDDSVQTQIATVDRHW